MTWLPISLKNAAKCDKWYQLQNHSITESLNANGAREKPFMGHPRACRILSVEHVYKKRKKLNARVLCSKWARPLFFSDLFRKSKGGCGPRRCCFSAILILRRSLLVKKRKEEKVRKCFFLFSFLQKHNVCINPKNIATRFCFYIQT